MTVGDFDPMKGPRLAKAWLAMEEVMSDGEWHYRDDLVEVGLASSDLQLKTVQYMLAKLSAPDGPMQRKGSVKTRRYRMVVE
jgi:hypothetical protein